MAAKDTEIGTWSDWSVAVHATPWIVNPVPSTPTTEVTDGSGMLKPQLDPWLLPTGFIIIIRLCLKSDAYM